MNDPTQSLLGLALGATVLCYVVYAKASEHRFRCASIRVQGKVLKAFPHRHSTSYFLSYEFDGVARAAEYCGTPIRRELEPGDVVEILIDPRDPPDSEVPEATHNAPGRGVGAGNCALADSPLFGLWDGVYVAASIALIAHALS